jgi:Domain of unknown function (DUF4160)
MSKGSFRQRRVGAGVGPNEDAANICAVVSRRFLRDEGFDVRIYTLDHPPPHVHVHVAKAGAIVRIDLATRTVTEIVGMISDRGVNKAERLVARHAKRLKTEWTKIHGRD